MEIGITQVFGEPGYAFNISFKVNVHMSTLLTTEFNKLVVKDELPQGYDLRFQISTKPDIKSFIYTEKPHIDRKYKFYTYYLVLPYEPIKLSDNELDTYLDFAFDGITPKLISIGFSDNQVYLIRKLVKEEVVNNPEYENIIPWF